MTKAAARLLSRRDFLQLSGIAISGLKLKPTSTSIAVTAETPAVPVMPGQHALRELAVKRGLQVGTGISGKWFTDPQAHEKYQEIVGREFNVAVVNWGLYWPNVEPQQNYFDFSTADQQVSFAQQKRMSLRGHPLVFPTAPQTVPDWIVKGNFSRDRLIGVLRNHITRLVSYYRGKVREWVVVNEPYLLPHRPNDIFHQTIGADYLEIAFRAAREADPSATLIYNDTDNHTSAGITTNLTRKNLQLIKSQSLVDVVGMQMHLDGARPPARKEIIATMKSYELPVYVTEMDVNMKDVAGTQDEKYRVQAKIYREAVEACLDSGVCHSITFWEVGDKYSWAEWPKDAPHASPNADMTLFDDNLEPKPAYYAIRDVLSHKLKLP